MRFHQDDRGTRYCDVFPEIGKGDINATVVQPGACALWHRHKHQNDFQFVVKGALKIGVCNTANYDNCYSVIKREDKIENMSAAWKNNYRLIAELQLSNFFVDKSTAYLGIAKVTNVVDSIDPRCKWIYLSERNASEGPLFIPAGLWHGCYNYTNEEAILIYHITNKYNESEPDEERCDPKTMGWEYERKAK